MVVKYSCSNCLFSQLLFKSEKGSFLLSKENLKFPELFLKIFFKENVFSKVIKCIWEVRFWHHLVN